MISDPSTRFTANVGFTDDLLNFRPELDPVEDDADTGYGRFTVEGLERGWGTTLGNSLRRVLLGAMPGIAITSARIQGITHEYSTVPHMREGVAEFLINVRGIRIREVSETTQRVLRINVTGESEVKAGDIQDHSAFKIVNPQLRLATLEHPDAKLTVDFEVERGEGYRRFDPEVRSDLQLLPVDAIFTPVLKVNYEVQNLSGKLSGREGLTIEVWTDRTIMPGEALRTAARILVGKLGIFTGDAHESDVPSGAVPPGMESTVIKDLAGVLSTRVINALNRHGIDTIGDLSRYTPDNLKRDVRNFGEKSFNELVDYMVEKGIWERPE